MRPLSSIVSIAALLSACGGAPDQDSAPSGSRYGGVFNMNETEAIRSIFPLTLTQASAYRIASQIYQGLVRFDPVDLHILPCLAEKWDVDATATVYTFHLRNDVRFHDDPMFPDGKGRELNADDVVRCFTAICTHGQGDQMFWLFQDRVAGANAYFAATSKGDPPKKGVQGIEKLDDLTVRITLTHPSLNFLQVMAHQGCWIWPHELAETYPHDLMAHAIGTGPFRLKLARPGESMVLERDPHYWRRDTNGDPLPYLDAVRITFAEDKNNELEEFLKGHLSAMLELPVERVDVLKDSLDAAGHERFLVRSVPALTVQFYGFNSMKPPFDDLLVRKAFALAIDRHLLVDSVLRGLAVIADHGLVPPGMSGYPYAEVSAIPFAPDSARKLLALAGYPDGKGFPSVLLQVNNDGFGYVRYAEAVQEMLQHELHVAIAVSVLPADQHYERIEMAKALFWREGWIADHPDPENFLSLLYGKNAVLDTAQPASLNNTRYHNSSFDSLFARAQQTTDDAKRMALLAQAERIAMADMPIAPLYHERAVRLLQPWVRDLPLNPLESLDLSDVWFDRSVMKDH